MSEEKKDDGLFNPTTNTSTISFQEQNLIKAIVALVQHEVNISIDEKIEILTNRVEGLENDMITSDGFSDAFSDELYNQDIATKDDLGDVITDKLDELLEELKITRS